MKNKTKPKHRGKKEIKFKVDKKLEEPEIQHNDGIIARDYFSEGEEPTESMMAKDRKVEIIFQLIVKGYNSKSIARYCQEKLNCGTERTAHRYIHLAKERILEYNGDSLKFNLAWHIARRMNLLRRAQKDKNGSLELDVAKDLARLQGLYSDRFELIIKDETLYNKQANDLLKKLREIPYEEVIDGFGGNTETESNDRD